MTPPEPVVRYTVSGAISGTTSVYKHIFDTIYTTLNKYEDGVLVESYTHVTDGAYYALRDDGTLTVAYHYSANFSNVSFGWYHDTVSSQGVGSWFERAGTSSSVSQVAGGWTANDSVAGITNLLTNWDTLVPGLTQDDVSLGKYLAEVEE